jgi:tRNA-specific 2-thiouridylase
MDANKDQSYFLHAVPREEFAGALFPLGELHKEAVRHKARVAGLPNFDKPDSTGICFIGERPFEQFLARYIADSPGPIESLQGERLGQHRGLPFYTLGQRDGLRIGGQRNHAAEPWYVVRKDTTRNALIVGQRHEHSALECSRLRTGAMNWLAAQGPSSFSAAARIRYRQPDQPCRVQRLAMQGLELAFDQPQRAATVGQYAVLYDGERCLGGAVIAETL